MIHGMRTWLIPAKKTEIVQEIQAPVAVKGNEVEAATIPDFASILDVKAKKKAFFDYLRPAIVQQNAVISQDRQAVLELKQQLDEGNALNETSTELLNEIAAKYRFTFQEYTEVSVQKLLRRVDVIPENMVLIQAANESGWGNSRFAREGFNFFGQWCFSAGCGLVPKSRTPGLNHEVAKFSSMDASVTSYMRNLNTNAAYHTFRTLRENIRLKGEQPKASDLVYGLMNYSERKGDYIDELLLMLEHNQSLLVNVG
ncbi:glucosaminidase [Shewanella sp. SNU WT4]|nr:glucosaminidase domain-containing protein [Shewanella sp. SNU WT4]QDF68518.1 glucosaminidase [Shewanella sp. SNU WT4]